MARGIEDIITELYDVVKNAWGVPLGNEKCVVERNKVLDLLDEISSQMPSDIKQARAIVDSRNDVIANAKREAENILRQAEERAQVMISENEVYKQAQIEARDMIKNAQQKIRELREVTNEYVDDAMRRTEEAMDKALADVRDSRAKFNALTGSQSKAASPIIEDI